MATASPSSFPLEEFHCIRITSHSKIHTCVSAALSHLKKVDSLPLCLHTLPPVGATDDTIDKAIAASKRNPSNNGVGRLISIVEIIKREYESERTQKACQPGSTTSQSLLDTAPVGLHQYNQFGSLESLQAEDETKESNDEVANAIKIAQRHDLILKEFLHEERKRPRQTHTPYMKIYLSRSPILSLERIPDVYHQEPTSSRKRAIVTTQPIDVSIALAKPTLVNYAEASTSQIAPV